MQKSASAAQSRIPYLDGLRAYAIIAVLLSHTAHFMSGGALHVVFRLERIVARGNFGVRVFFVLSGYLITTLLINEMGANGRISISGFYERRVARIIPALYTYIFVVSVLALLHLADLKFPAILSAATFTWNYSVLWGAPAAAAGPILGHMWTLSLEEQFYLIWPTLLVFLGLRVAKRTALVIVIIEPFVRLGSYYLTPSLRGQLMMMCHTGTDQIMWGALLAFAAREGWFDHLRGARYRWMLPWISAFTAFAVCPVLDAKIRGIELVAVPSLECGSVVLMISWLLSGEGGILRRILESWPVVQLGLLSYSIYVWQQMFLVWPGTSFLGFPLNLVVVLLVGIASYRLIEMPARRIIRRWFSQAQLAH